MSHSPLIRSPLIQALPVRDIQAKISPNPIPYSLSWNGGCPSSGSWRGSPWILQSGACLFTYKTIVRLRRLVEPNKTKKKYVLQNGSWNPYIYMYIYIFHSKKTHKSLKPPPMWLILPGGIDVIKVNYHHPKQDPKPAFQWSDSGCPGFPPTTPPPQKKNDAKQQPKTNLQKKSPPCID